MAIALVQNRTAQAGYVDSFALAFNSNVTANNLLTACGGGWNGNDITSIPHSDSVGTGYSVLLGAATSNVPIKPWIAYGIAAGSGGNTVTIDPNGSGRAASYTIAEWSGIDSAPLDVNGGNSTGNSAAPSDGITTVAADTVVLAVVVHGHGGDIAITENSGGGWSLLGEIESVSLAPHNAQYQIFSSAGAKTASWTIGASQGWCAMTASFKKAAGGGGATLVHRALMLGVGI